MKYRKKPVVIEAYQFTQEVAEGGEFPGVRDKATLSERYFGKPIDSGRYYVYTLDGSSIIAVLENDWIIQGANGEYRTCKPDIFEKTYEAVMPFEDYVEENFQKHAEAEKENAEFSKRVKENIEAMEKRFEEKRALRARGSV